MYQVPNLVADLVTWGHHSLGNSTIISLSFLLSTGLAHSLALVALPCLLIGNQELTIQAGYLGSFALYLLNHRPATMDMINPSLGPEKNNQACLHCYFWKVILSFCLIRCCLIPSPYCVHTAPLKLISLCQLWTTSMSEGYDPEWLEVKDIIFSSFIIISLLSLSWHIMWINWMQLETALGQRPLLIGDVDYMVKQYNALGAMLGEQWGPPSDAVQARRSPSLLSL